MVAVDEVISDSALVEVKMTGRTTHSDVAGGSDGQRLSAHIRTAAMLFVVTAVFLLTFAPAFLISLNVVPNIRLIFYIYFFNNVADPLIYSFMNSYFRRELNAMFCQLAAGGIAQ